MIDSERPEFAKIMLALAATFRQESSAALIEGYWMGLSDLAMHDIRRSAGESIRTSKFMPTPAELRERIVGPSPQDRAVLAWDAALRAESLHGYYDSVDFDDKLINATIRGMGGWPRFSERLEREDTKWLRKEFENLYAAYMRTGVGTEAIAHLPGEFEQHNGARYTERLLQMQNSIAAGTLYVGSTIKKIATGLPSHAPGLIPVVAAVRKPVPIESANVPLKAIEDGF